MKLQPLPLVIVFAALTPSLALSQNPQVTNCHTPESSGNFVGSDETCSCSDDGCSRHDHHGIRNVDAHLARFWKA